MKTNLTFLTVLLAFQSVAFGWQAHTITLKQKVTLIPDSISSPYSSSARLCVDVQTQQVLQPNDCNKRDDRRKCQVFAYNLKRSADVPVIPAGTVFKVNTQMGPETTTANIFWNETADSFVKVFSNLTGKDGDFSNPNLIIQCTEHHGMVLPPFSLEEIQEAFKDILTIQ